jgi:formate dehydrogenase maturation protein FdhE
MQRRFDLTLAPPLLPQRKAESCPACGGAPLTSPLVTIHGQRFHRSCATYSSRRWSKAG